MRVQVEHYQLFLLLGIIMWNFLDRSTSMGMLAIIGKPSLVQKVYFPRDLLIISACTTALMMTMLEFLIFVAFMVIFDVTATAAILYFPLIFVLQFVVVFGLSLALSALNVFYRDVQFIWRVILQAGFFATPILYPITIFPPDLQRLVMINPMARIITMSRDCILYRTVPAMGDLAFLAASALIVLLVGYLIFNRLEPRFAEEI